MLLEAIAIYAAYKVANRYNNLKEEELLSNDEIKNLERQVKILELRKRIDELTK